MITNRQRGLVRIHGAAGILAVAVFFWVYAELIMRYVPVVRLSREVNLLPYFLCVVIGLLLASGRLRSIEAKLTRLTGPEAATLASFQVGLIALAVFTMMFATLDRTMSRLFLGTFLVGSWVGLTWLHRKLPRTLAAVLYNQGERVPTLFVGRAKSLPSLQSWLEQRTHLGLLPAGFVSLDERALPKSENGNAERAKFETLTDESLKLATGGSEFPHSAPGDPLSASSLADLPRILEEKAIGQVILMDLPADEAVARAIIGHCQSRGCRLLIQQKIDQIVGHPVVSVDEGGYHFLALHREPLEEPLNRALKRAFDIVVSLPVVVIVLPPLIAVVWVMQRRQAPGPLFYVRPRSGEARVEFPMLKFRSMRSGPVDVVAEAHQATTADARVYPFGAFMRRRSLDEFPQFWNVLKGDMSIVGPRPVMPLLDAEFERQVSAYRSKHWVKPGITGLAQSEGFRGEITTPSQLQERIRLDLYYIAHWSIWLDVQIAIKTAGQIFSPPKSAY